MKDLHKERAAEIFKVPLDQVTIEQRRYAKMVNYVDMYSNEEKFGEFLKRHGITAEGHLPGVQS